MRKIIAIVLGSVLFTTAIFAGGPANEGTSAADASTAVQTKTKRKRSGGLVGRTWRGGKFIFRKGAHGTRLVYHKSKRGVFFVGRQVKRGGKWTFTKTVRGTRSFIKGADKILFGKAN